jgi:hypothetical protein
MMETTVERESRREDQAKVRAMPAMNREQRRKYNQQMARINNQRPERLEVVPRDKWPEDGAAKRFNVMLSKYFLVQMFNEDDGMIRLSINRTLLTGCGRFFGEISWDELQDVKRQAGYADRCAFEVYPTDNNIINVANMRHLWVLPEGENSGWIKKD